MGKRKALGKGSLDQQSFERRTFDPVMERGSLVKKEELDMIKGMHVYGGLHNGGQPIPKSGQRQFRNSQAAQQNALDAANLIIQSNSSKPSR